MKSFAGLLVGCVTLASLGCNSPHEPGPIISLYKKDGGPNYIRGGGNYDPAVINHFFETHHSILDDFVGQGGVCSNHTDPVSDEATQNGLICQTAVAEAMGRDLNKDLGR